MSHFPFRALLVLLGVLLLAACGSSNVEPIPPTSPDLVFTFTEGGVYRLPASLSAQTDASGALYFGEQPVILWQTDEPAEAFSFFYAPVTATRHSELSALFWDARGDGVSATPASLPETLETEAQTTASHLYWQEEDNKYQSEADMASPWLWEKISAPNQWQDEIVIPENTSAPYTLTVRLWAQTAMPVQPDHHVQLLWDDVLVGDETWDGIGLHTISAALPDVSPGKHTVTIRAPGDTEALADVVFVDGWGVTAQQLLDIRQQPVTWQATTATARLLVEPAQPIWLLDITNPLAPVAAGPAIASDSALTIATRPGHRYWAGAAEQILAPPAQRPRHILSAEQRQALAAADYIAVGDETFLAAAQPLLDYRNETGLMTAALTTQQLLDTWGEGTPGVTAWDNFMQWRRQQGQLPRYLLLLGDADLSSWAGDEPTLSERLPAAFVRTTYIGETPSDAALLGADADAVAIGRIPARTVAEVEAVVQKTLAYENGPKSRRHLILDDDAIEFEFFADDIAETWQRLAADESLRFSTGDPNARTDLLAALQEEPAWLHYVGHGSPLLWSKNQVLSAEDASAWDAPAVVFAWTCLSGYFVLPDQRSLAEQWLLSPQGGAVAVIAPTGEDITPNQQPYADAIYQALPEAESLGAALASIRSQWQQPEIAWQYHLFGDPALSLRPGIQQ